MPRPWLLALAALNLGSPGAWRRCRCRPRCALLDRRAAAAALWSAATTGCADRAPLDHPELLRSASVAPAPARSSTACRAGSLAGGVLAALALDGPRRRAARRGARASRAPRAAHAARRRLRAALAPGAHRVAPAAIVGLERLLRRPRLSRHAIAIAALGALVALSWAAVTVASTTRAAPRYRRAAITRAQSLRAAAARRRRRMRRAARWRLALFSVAGFARASSAVYHALRRLPAGRARLVVSRSSRVLRVAGRAGDRAVDHRDACWSQRGAATACTSSKWVRSRKAR